MSEPDEIDRDELEDDDDDPPRGLFSALWFRALLVVLALGVIAIFAAPSLIEVVAPRGDARTAALPAASPASDARTAASSSATGSPDAVPPAGTLSGGSSDAASASAPAARDSASKAAREGPPDGSKDQAATAPAMPSAPAPSPGPARRSPATVASGPKASAPSMSVRAEPPQAQGVVAAAGPYWVQVAAFKDPESAHRLASRLRAQHYRVEESTHGGAGGTGEPPAPAAAADRYEVFVADVAPAEVGDRLKGKSVAPEAVAGGIVLKPSLPLAQALELSRELAGDGRRVQVRRAGGGDRRGTPTSAGTTTFHRVRVGGFADRAAAEVVARELEGKGYRPFIARGDQ